MQYKDMEGNGFHLQYINIKLMKGILLVLSVISFVFLCFYDYDYDFKWVIILPITYVFCLFFFVNNEYGHGLGKITLIFAYAFRMCILPMLCAYGNFWLEPSKSVYIEYFTWAVILMAVENIFVFACMSHYFKKYGRLYNGEKKEKKYKKSDSVIIFCLFAAVVLMIVLFAISVNVNDYYHFILTSDSSEVEGGTAVLQGYGARYYLIVLLDILFRPVISFCLINKLLQNKNMFKICLAFVIAIANILIMTDRRVLSLMIGLVCLMEIVFVIRSEFAKNIMYIIVAISAVGTVFFCFSTDMLVPHLVARKFQRYFSGPTLTAIGINILVNNTPSVLDFLKLLFNNSIILTGLFGNVEVRSYVLELCGSAGTSIWTPMIIGIFQYFKVLAPIVLGLFVKYIVRNDFVSENTNGMKKMILDYLSVSVAIYMIMYSAELVAYNIIFIGGFFWIVLYLNKKFKITVR